MLFSNQEKVELSLISDIDKAYDEALRFEKNLSKLAQTIELDAGKASNEYQIVINKCNNALKAAKELGADDIIRTINARKSDAEVSKKEMDSIVSKVKSFSV